ncbi:MAG: ABC-F family ATP-binding cassette domain-containing protein [Lutibacter sp.]|uniref:ABC-F family ATP-binding cassette domain-containing protein n=1 Tax=Lutibacter sp. TaxID=1925666 RepID=UPI00185F16EA|nr:ABC-F family ATP-binding cassette domain-containing protein [Lutibacter sp.]MBT8316817.1 ABC-F family ATP-binding cassette domain-containing protein [Lutibacter sp.]NNJ57677.1 ABC-F family ATP-binding cassette domain-containing protein [Lutibacter sp.]
MLNAHNVSISFGGTDLFSGITFKLDAGNRVGLIGKNGAGKSTLLKIIAKELECDTGTMAFEKNTSIGFLKQDIEFTYGRTILEEAYTAFVEIKAVEKQLSTINESLAERKDYESVSYHDLLHELDDLTHRYDLLGGYNYQGDTEKILQGLGFKREDFGKLTETFSGGWRMRIELAKLLLQKNDILLLDEPTNHLDIESIIWLENFLKNYPGAVVLVSHDKMFLDNVSNRTIEISLGKIYDYNKPYTQFLELRKDIKEKQAQAQKNQEKEIKQTEQLIEKFRYKASKAAFAQSLIKKLDKVERIEVDADDNSVLNLRFPVSIQPGKIIFEGENLAKNYGNNQVLESIDLLIERNSKIAFVGQNGQGKSTLAKMMVGDIDFNGNLKLGHNVQIGYFAQNQAEYLDGEQTVLQIMEDASTDANRTKLRDMLGSFLFRGEDVDKKVKVLSGGERNRLALCKMLLSPFNVLIMDEPTNHLDIPSKNVLKQALKNFEGTLILVSHDRDFLQGLSNKVYEFKNKVIKEYLGDIDYYLEQHNLEDFREVEKRDVEKTTTKTTGKDAYLEKKQQEKQAKQLTNRLSKVEKTIANLEKEILNLDAEIFENSEKVNANPDFFKNYQAKKHELDELMDEWAELQEKIENCS